MSKVGRFFGDTVYSECVDCKGKKVPAGRTEWLCVVVAAHAVYGGWHRVRRVDSRPRFIVDRQRPLAELVPGEFERREQQVKEVSSTLDAHACIQRYPLIIHRRSIAERGGCFQRRLVVCYGRPM